MAVGILEPANWGSSLLQSGFSTHLREGIKERHKQKTGDIEIMGNIDNMDVDGTAIIRNLAGPITSNWKTINFWDAGIDARNLKGVNPLVLLPLDRRVTLIIYSCIGKIAKAACVTYATGAR